MTTSAEPRQWTEREVKRALWQHFTAQGYAVLDEVSTEGDDHRFRRIDLLCVRGAKKLGIGPHEVLALEVKVSRTDFLNDVKRPEKQAPWRELAHRHAYVVPAGLVSPEEVPDGHGLITVDEGRLGWDKVAWVKKVRFDTKVVRLPARIITGWAYELARYQSLERGLNPLVADASVGELQAAKKQLEKDLENARRARTRAEDTARAWREYAKGLTGTPCGTCGEELRAGKRERYALDGFRWRHPNKAHEAACAVQRREAARLDSFRIAMKDHEYNPDRYPKPDLDTYQPRHWNDIGPRPANHPDEEPPCE